MPLSAVNDYAENVIAPRLARISGVGQVVVNGQQRYAVRVQVDPDKLRSLKIGLNEVERALQDWNVTVPTGTLAGLHATYNLKVGGQLADAAAFRPIVVTSRHGVPVHLGDIANVIDSVENNRTGAWNYTSTEIPARDLHDDHPSARHEYGPDHRRHPRRDSRRSTRSCRRRSTSWAGAIRRGTSATRSGTSASRCW